MRGVSTRGTRLPARRARRAGSAGVVLAVLALLGQLVVAAPHEAEQLISVLYRPNAAAESTGTAVRAGHPVPAHDPASCPICQASALARTALSSSWSARAPLPVEPIRRLIPECSAREPAAPVDATAAPRAPPAWIVAA